MITCTVNASTISELVAKLREVLADNQQIMQQAQPTPVEKSEPSPTVEIKYPPPPAPPVEEPTVTELKPKAKPGRKPEGNGSRPEITMLELRQALTAYLKTNSEADAVAILKKVGKGERLSKVEPALYRATYDAIVAAT